RAALQGHHAPRQDEGRQAQPGVAAPQGRRAGRVLRALQGGPRRAACPNRRGHPGPGRSHRAGLRAAQGQAARPQNQEGRIPEIELRPARRRLKVRPMRSALVTTVLLLAGSLAYAQGGTTPQISYEAITGAPQGAWAEYETSMKGQTQKVTMRYALVEKS